MASAGSHNTGGVTDPDPIIGPGHTFETVTDKISSIVLVQGTKKAWLAGFAIAFAFQELWPMKWQTTAAPAK